MEPAQSMTSSRHVSLYSNVSILMFTALTISPSISRESTFVSAMTLKLARHAIGFIKAE